MDSVKVLLADDHALFRSGIAELLQSVPEFEVVGEASDGEEAVRLAAQLMPDIILMDVYMPGMTGLEATREIKKILPYVKIIMLTASGQDKDLFEAVKAGAHGFLMKNMDRDEFFSTLRGTVAGEAAISRSTASRILTEFSRLADARATVEARISPRETEVLELVSTGKTNREIASALHISENTVKNHLKNILEKLHLKNRVQAAAYALRKGIGEPRDPHLR